MDLAGIQSGAVGVEAITRIFPEECLGHLAAGRVAGA
jgi:hypothetical protein